MRPIKFRAWDIKQESMWDVREIDFDNMTAFVSRMETNKQTGNLERISNNAMKFAGRNPDIILEQRTPLSDKNGKDSFVGDKIIDDDFEGIKTIELSDMTCGFIARGETGFYHHLSSMGNFEVVGTIHDKEKP